MRVTYRARGKTWEVASGLIGDKVFYYKAVEFCPPVSCEIPIVSSIKFRYAASRKAEYDKLLESMVRTIKDPRPKGRGIRRGEPLPAISNLNAKLATRASYAASGGECDPE